MVLVVNEAKMTDLVVMVKVVKIKGLVVVVNGVKVTRLKEGLSRLFEWSKW